MLPYHFSFFTKPPLWQSLLINGFFVEKALWKMKKNEKVRFTVHLCTLFFRNILCIIAKPMRYTEKNAIKITELTAQYSCSSFVFLYILFKYLASSRYRVTSYWRIVKNWSTGYEILSCSTVIFYGWINFNGQSIKNYSTKSKYCLSSCQFLLWRDSTFYYATFSVSSLRRISKVNTLLE